MKVRDSGMPDENMWNSFFDVEKIFRGLEIDNKITSLVEIGCGYGTFTIPAAKIINGKVTAFDIEEDIVSRLKQITAGNKKIEIINRDIIFEGTGIKSSDIDYVMLFNILHHEKPHEILGEAFRILKTNGKAGIIHWRTDIDTPRGPAKEIRPEPEYLEQEAIGAGFKIKKHSFILEPWHYGILLEK